MPITMSFVTGSMASCELDDPVVVLDRAGLGLDHAANDVHDVRLVVGRLEI